MCLHKIPIPDQARRARNQQTRALVIWRRAQHGTSFVKHAMQRARMSRSPLLWYGPQTKALVEAARQEDAVIPRVKLHGCNEVGVRERMQALLPVQENGTIVAARCHPKARETPTESLLGPIAAKPAGYRTYARFQHTLRVTG